MADRPLPQLILHDGTPYGFPRLAEELRRLADMAEKGEIVSFAYGAEKRSGGCMFAGWHDIGSTAHGLVGAIEAVKYRIIRRYLVTPENE